MSARWTALPVAASLLFACHAELREGHFACTDDSSCPSGWFCREDNRCWRTATGTDGGPSDGGDVDDASIDGGGPIDGSDPSDTGTIGPCDPVTQAGCGAGERCTWILANSGVGAFECRPDGTLEMHAECTASSNDAPDDCGRGLVCVGTCEKLCDLASPGSCAPGFACSAYSGLSDTGIGACTATCDPVRQTRDYDGAAACGSPDPTSPSLGCYGRPEGPFQCARVVFPDRTHGASAHDGSGTVYLNSCAPGFMPFPSGTDSIADIVCLALCDPEPSHLLSTSALHGLSPYACRDRGASGATTECRFMDAFVGMRTVPEIGICLDYPSYRWDADGNGDASESFPSCAGVPPEHDGNMNGTTDTVELGCTPLP